MADTAKLKAAILRANKWGYVSALFGPRYAAARQEIMEAATGELRAKSRCGINVVVCEVELAAKFDGADIAGRCMAERQDLLAAWVRSVARA